MKYEGLSQTSKTAVAGLFALACLISLSFVVSCAPPGAVKPGAANSIEPYAHLDAEEKIAMSEVMADDAEEKISFATLNEAWGKFAEALQLNPENHRALFWKEMLSPILEMKGIVGRIRPVYMKQENGIDRYTALALEMEKNSSPEYRRFIVDGAGDLDTEEKFSAWMDRLVVSLDTLRVFLKANKDRTYSLRAPVRFLVGVGAKMEDGNRCAALKIMGSKFTGCPETGMLSFKANRADLEALQHVVSIQMLQLSVLSAYKLNGSALFESNLSLTPKLFLARLSKGVDGGLMERNRLSVANSIVPDWVTAQRYFLQNQDQVCKHGPQSDENRPGMLISSGFCVSNKPGDDGPKTLELLEMMLLGQPIKVELKFLERPVAVYPLKFFNEPPKNITAMLPTEFDAEEKASAFNDTAFSPYFAQGSISDIKRAERREEAETTLRERGVLAPPGGGK